MEDKGFRNDMLKLYQQNSLVGVQLSPDTHLSIPRFDTQFSHCHCTKIEVFH